MLNRRDFLAVAGSSLAVAAPIGRSFAQQMADFVEIQRGDPFLPGEELHIDLDALYRKISGTPKASFKERVDLGKLTEGMLAIAARYADKNVSRTTAQPQIEEVLSLFGLSFRYSSGVLVPFCAAGVAFCAAQAYADLLKIDTSGPGRVQTFQTLLPDLDHHYYYASASCIDIYFAERAKHRWLEAQKPKWAARAWREPTPRRGWLIIYDFKKTGDVEIADHCGLVESYDAATRTIHTIEFNTSDTNNQDGGAVARKSRPYDASVKAFVTYVQQRD
jgi:hypothetical protein